jgi:hypothetical protein
MEVTVDDDRAISSDELAKILLEKLSHIRWMCRNMKNDDALRNSVLAATRRVLKEHAEEPEAAGPLG